MDYEELRPFVLEYLKEKPETQVIELVRAVEDRLIRTGVYKDEPEWMSGITGTHKMPEEDQERVREIISELLVEGIFDVGAQSRKSRPALSKSHEIRQRISYGWRAESARPRWIHGIPQERDSAL